MPLILERSETVFLHMSRTGGTWVRTALQRAGVPCRMEGNPHAAYWECCIPHAAFTIIRHPLQWYPSIWAHEQLYGEQLYGEINNWVQGLVTEYPGYMMLMHQRCLSPGVRVITTEMLAEQLCTVLENIGESFDRDAMVSTPPAYIGATFPGMADRVKLTEESQGMIQQSEHEIVSRYYRE